MSTTTKIGLLSGFLFFAHAMVPYSHAWPLLWPLLGGALAVYLRSRQDKLSGLGGSLGAAAKIGITAAVFFFVATAAALAALGQPQFASAAQVFGAEEPVVVNAAVLVALAVAGVAGFGAAMIAGLFVHPLARRSG